MEKDEYLFALQDVNTFKEQFLVPHYRLRNLLEIFNNEVELIRKEKLNGMLLIQKMKELKKMRRQMANSKIEIYFCNVSNNEKLKPFANAVMPYGLLHVGIMIDDMAIQWGRSVLGKSLVLPSNDVLYDDYIFAIEIENKEIWNLIKEKVSNFDEISFFMVTSIASKIINDEHNKLFNLDNSYYIISQNPTLCKCGVVIFYKIRRNNVFN